MTTFTGGKLQLRTRNRMAKKLVTDYEYGTRDVGVLASDNAIRLKRLWSHSWHKTDANHFPSDRRQFDDFERLIRDWILPGHTPAEPMLSASDLVVTLGSCFARELRTSLGQAGLLATTLRIPEGLNNTYALLDFVAWCVKGSETGRGFRYDRLESGEIQEWVADEERETFVRAFADAGAFVFTIGLAEVWQDRETGGVFWRGVPKEIFDADRHVFRLTTVEENAGNILEMVDLVRQVNPTAPIVVTLSPVPLEATFRDISCMTADSVSKSVLRVAIDQAMGEHRANVYYWPSFEIVRWAGAHVSWPAYGFHDDRSRHVTRYSVGRIIDAFVEAFYVPDAVALMRSRKTPTKSPTSLAGRWEAIGERRRKRAAETQRNEKRRRRREKREKLAAAS
jgi:hypothetical protein